MTEWILSSCILILVVIGLRTVLKGKISLRLQYAIWGLVLLRLLVPVSFGSTNFSVANLVISSEPPAVQSTLKPNTQNTTNTSNPSHKDIENEIANRYEELGIEVEVHVDGPLDLTAILRDAAPVVWTIGFISIAGLFLFTNLRFKRKILDSRYELDVRKNKLDVYATSEIDTPCLFGIKNPAIYVTYPVADNQTLLRHTLEHEATHYRHGDHLWSVLRCICLAIHWYNPLVWWAAFLSRQDGELACDEATIQRLGEGERAEYGRTLIGMTCQKKSNVLITATTMNSGKHSLRERIVLIAKKPKMAVYTLVAVLLISAIAVGCTFTGAKNNAQMYLQLEESIIDYCIERDVSPGAREDYHFIGSVNDCALVYYTGMGPTLNLYRYDITDGQIEITDMAGGEFAISGGLSINHIVEGDKHIYFGTISDSHWIPEDDTTIQLSWKNLVFWDAEANQKIVNLGSDGYICVMDEPMVDFWVVVNNGYVLLDKTKYLDQGYYIHESEWFLNPQMNPPATIPAEESTDPTQTPTEMPDNAPPTSLPDTLHEEPDPEKICIGVQPTALSKSCFDLYYIIPENQELLQEYYQAAVARGTEPSWDSNVKMAGWYILYQGEEWQVFDDGSLRGEMSIAEADAKELYEFCKDAIQEAGIGEPVRPKDILGITTATLYWNGVHTVTDSYVLDRLEMLLTNSSYYGSVQCPFTAHLELVLENGETLLLAMSTDSCASWMSEGVAYGYGEMTNVGIEGNEEFYSFFLADVIHEKAQEGVDAMAEYWPYMNWGLYARKYSIEDTFTLMDMFKAYVLDNPTDWMICVALTTTRGLDGAYSEYYATLIGELFEAAPATFNFACRQMIPEQYVEAAVNYLAYYWEITPEEARARLDAAGASG